MRRKAGCEGWIRWRPRPARPATWRGRAGDAAGAGGGGGGGGEPPGGEGGGEARKRDELRAAQKPLKEHYREDPGAALITLKAKGDLDDTHVACSVDTGRALVQAGLHPATGGNGTLACSGDMLLEALVACAGVTLR